MSETRPRDLTAEELAVLKALPNRGGESVPLPIPPGTQVAVELISPAGKTASVSGRPMTGPGEVPSSVGGGALGGSAPTQNPPQS
jgi:hypothetical protein